MVWKGVILEESLEDKSILKLVKIIKTDVSKLGGEDRVMTFHYFELDDKDKDRFVNRGIKAIKQSFYMHIVKEGVMYVIYKSHMFKFSKGFPELETAREYGLSIGIIKKQMPFEKLLKNPFG